MAPKSAGYSGTPLARKLGYKAGMRARLIQPPDSYLSLLEPLPDDVQFLRQTRGPIDLAHLFVTTEAELIRRVPPLHRHLSPTGMIWVSWPKGSSGVATDLNGNRVRELVLETGLVDIKVCAVDETWSGLKFVIRKADR